MYTCSTQAARRQWAAAPTRGRVGAPAGGNVVGRTMASCSIFHLSLSMGVMVGRKRRTTRKRDERSPGGERDGSLLSCCGGGSTVGWLGRRIERPSLSETIAMKRPGFSAAAGSTPVLRAESWAAAARARDDIWPADDESATVLWESNTICRYLAPVFAFNAAFC